MATNKKYILDYLYQAQVEKLKKEWVFQLQK